MNQTLSRSILGFGSMLFDTVNKVYVSSNHLLLDKPRHDGFFLTRLSLWIYYMQRPSSGWVLAGLPNVDIQVMRMPGIPIGAGVQLPGHIKKSKSIDGQTDDIAHKQPFVDNLCLFRCLPPEQDFRTDVRSLERPANDFRRQLENNIQVSPTKRE